jgi:two-component system cell cycle sensor histidine kinase/response regulator CckA
MKDDGKTKKQVVGELEAMRQRIAELEASEAEHKQVEEALRDSEERYRSLVQQSKDAIFLVGTDGSITFASPACQTIFGYSPDEFVADPNLVGRIVHPDYREAFNDFWRKYRDNGVFPNEDLEWAWIRNEGQIVYTENHFTNLLDEHGSVIGFQTIARDITERKQAEEALRIKESAVASSANAIALADLEGNLTYVNPAFLQLWGYADEEEVLGKPAVGFWQSEANAAQVLEALRDKQGWIGELVAKRKDGSLFNTQLSASMATDEAGKPVCFMASFADITERVRAEQALRNSEERYRRLFEDAVLGIFQSTRDGKFITVNPAFARMFGYDSAQDVIDSVNDAATDIYVDPSRRPSIVRLVIESDGPIKVETQYRRKNGDIFFGNLHAWAVRDDDGRFLYLEGFVEDITERKRADQGLRESEEKYRHLFELESDAIFLIDNEMGRILEVNAAASALYGYSREELLQKKNTDLSAEPDQTTKATLEGWTWVPVRFHCKKDGTIFPVEITASHFTWRGRSVHVAAIRDITERLRAEQALRESELQYRTTLDSMGDVIHVVDTDLRFTLVNTAFKQWTKESGLETEVIGRTLFGIFPFLPDRIRDEYHQVFNSGKTLITEESTQLSGMEFISETRKIPIFEGGRVTRVVTVIRDITERVRLEEQLRQAQKMEAIGRLTAGIAHDFNNLLTAINGFAALMRFELAPDDPVQELAEKILDTGRRAADLVRQLLAFSHRQIIEPRTLDLNDIVSNMGEMLGRIIGEHIQMETILTPELWPVEVDPAQIEQVIVNLAVNARDAMPSGGRLTIETANVILDKDYVAGHVEATPGEHVLLAVSDTGGGMNEEIKAHIFEPFFTTRETGKGTGLGLATVYGIVRQSGGHIWVYSEENQGTTFKIYLPRARGAISWVARQPVMSDMPVGDETILLVEDDNSVRSLARRVLHSQGYTVLEAGNAYEALQVSAHHAGPIHLLLTDVVMPGASGKVLAEQLDQTRPDMKVLFMSGYTDDAIVHHGVLQAGIDFLEKPFSPMALAQKIRQVLDGTQQAQG